MPDTAFAATERQFLGLVASEVGPLSIDVSKYSMTGIPRGEAVAQIIAKGYLPIDSLWEQQPDALIVTGSEPLTTSLSDEAYWGQLTHLLQSFVGRAGSILLSCLSAHAALQILDGVTRRPLPTKCTGIFRQEVLAGHPILSGLASPLYLPHSRLNEVVTTKIERAGYDVLVGSDQHGWSVASKRVNQTELLLLQGHPEYSAFSLLREYRRDLERYVLGQRDLPPPLPTNCVDASDRPALLALHDRVLDGEKDPCLLEDFPFEQACGRAGWPWRVPAARMFTNWLALLRRQVG